MSSPIYLLVDINDPSFTIPCYNLRCEFVEQKSLESLDMSNIYNGYLYSWSDFCNEQKKRFEILDTLSIEYHINVKQYLKSNDSLDNVWFQVLLTLFQDHDCLETGIFSKVESLRPIVLEYDFQQFIKGICNEILTSEDAAESLKCYLKPLKLLSDLWTIPRKQNINQSYYLMEFLKILRSQNLCSNVILDLFEVFHREKNLYFFLTSVEDLDYVLTCFQKLKCDPFKIWNNDKDSVLVNYDGDLANCFRSQDILTICMMFECFEKCLLLLKYGVRNPTFYDEDGHFRKSILAAYDFPESISEPSLLDKPVNRTSFLVFQVMSIHFGANNSRFIPGLRGFSAIRQNYINRKLLIKLWRSLEDPLLTKQDFMDCVAYFGESFRDVLLNDWYWYDEHVWRDRTPVRTARSLRHLSGLSIRKRLEENYSLPCGVDTLPLPKSLLNYLHLKKNGISKWHMN